MPTKKEEEVLEIETEDEKADEALIEYDITAYPSDNTLRVLVEMWQNGDITIPDFQRGFVWTIKQSSLLIESFLIGLPVPPVFFYIDPENKNLVVDGQQRLLSVIFFFEGYFGPENNTGKRQIFKLTGINEKSKFHNKKFSDLDMSDRRKLENSVLRAINIRQLSPKEENTSIYHIFERLNTGGTPLTSQEIRNVVFRGSLLKKLKSLNTDKNWREILGKKTEEKHQKDVELILRAFALSSQLSEYEKPMTESMNKIAKRYKNSESQTVKKFVTNFPIACSIINGSLRKRPFNVRGPLNTSVFDSVFCTILNSLNKIPKDINKRYEALLSDKTFENYTSIGTTDTKTVKDRFAHVKRILID